jgi:glycosyltransferase involved in cell wall biosynthesis
MNLLKYVLITPARNEAQFIRQTLESLVAQTVRPVKWVIVSDGSTDQTDDFVSEYAARHDWIQLLRAPAREARHFAGKVFAFRVGYDHLRDQEFDVVGNIDADVEFVEDHFEFLLRKFATDPTLGVAGSAFVEDGRQYDYRFSNIENVWGGCQLFRRACFEDIGGYVPIKGGGIDHVAVVTARMKGWKTRTFTDRVCRHLRTMGTAQHGVLKSQFRAGAKDYSLGNHPLWQASRMIYQMANPPYVLGGLALMSGYLTSLLRGVRRPVSNDFVQFTRREQMRRLTAALSRGFGLLGESKQTASTSA